MVERALTNVVWFGLVWVGFDHLSPATPDVGRGARPRRSGTGATQPLGAPRGRPAWAGAALAPPTRSRLGDPGPGDPNPYLG